MLITMVIVSVAIGYRFHSSAAHIVADNGPDPAVEPRIQLDRAGREKSALTIGVLVVLVPLCVARYRRLSR
ncbi:MAG TPA: hypothetical protein VGJ59_08215 [Jatrophihabitantaceae bacterium]|jgi:hypothetical protein